MCCGERRLYETKKRRKKKDGLSRARMKLLETAGTRCAISKYGLVYFPVGFPISV